jgi:hypothetical protein
MSISEFGVIAKGDTTREHYIYIYLFKIYISNYI